MEKQSEIEKLYKQLAEVGAFYFLTSYNSSCSVYAMAVGPLVVVIVVVVFAVVVAVHACCSCMSFMDVVVAVFAAAVFHFVTVVDAMNAPPGKRKNC